ncbi:glutaredoxin 3 isoform X1 [Procambarus clarkii]|uniref:glutaredoxin 3 isoform X1 n=2 Tax=Procambarus clarkii TaxID=6728 RepID=UPI001E672A9B|nr:glutaredoxin 3-like isoform X1 [Procambarus clarkii]
MSVKKISSVDEFSALEKNNGLSVIHFMAEWAPQCEQMNDVITELSKQRELKEVTFGIAVAEDISDVSLKYNISAVPTIVLLRGGKLVERVDGANAAELTTKVKTQAAKASLMSTSPVAPVKDLNTRLKQLINSAKCMLFMKGSPDAPKCGFSRTTIDLLNKHEADYSSFDILTDEEVRQGLKTYSNWPTYPQVYIDGELIGGLDILKEMDDSGELGSMLPKKQKLEDRLKVLINKAPLMIFMKGERGAPRCGFSKTLIGILNETGLEYDTFDILTDEEVRQGLKSYSNWPTYPQIYVKGELVGGLDIIKELQSSGELMATLKGE